MSLREPPARVRLARSSGAATSGATGPIHPLISGASMNLPRERARKALLSKVDIRKPEMWPSRPSPPAGEQEARDWEDLTAWVRAEPSRAKALAERMVSPLTDAIRWWLTKSSDSSAEERRWKALQSFLIFRREKGDELLNIMLSAAEAEYERLRRADSTPPPALPGASDSVPRPKESPVPHLVPRDLGLHDEPAQKPSTKAVVAPVAGKEPAAPAAAAAQWRYLPVPKDEPDEHTEFDQRMERVPGQRARVIAARVRGKKHKHDGTNCDDWFEFGFEGPWTLIAVSDGAGSKKFSRVGSRTACREAIDVLRRELGAHRLIDRKAWTQDTFSKDAGAGTFAEADIERVQKAIQEAMSSALEAVKKAAAERSDSLAHERVLGRPVTLDDLSATLLLAVHYSVTCDEKERGFVMTCQVGDGMLAAVDAKGGMRLLGVPDSGEFAGQTDFLTSAKKLTRENLSRKMFIFFGPLRALAVMSDGVADDYFPNDPGVLRLYGDLVLNEILDPGLGEVRSIGEALAKTKVRTLEELDQLSWDAVVETPSLDGPRRIRVRSAASFADRLGVTIQELVASPALLSAGRRGPPLERAGDATAMLQTWLDSYQVRGSFDDRTLVVFEQERSE